MAEMMPVKPRQDILDPVRTKNGDEMVRVTGFVEMVANSIYHP